jgi:hypothetical protein
MGLIRSHMTVRRWRKKFLIGTESIKLATKCDRHEIVTDKANVSKLKVMTGTRFVILPKLLVHVYRYRGCMSFWSVFWNYEIFPPDGYRIHVYIDRWSKTGRVQIAKQLLKMFPKFNQRQFGNIVTGDETWVLYLEPVRTSILRVLHSNTESSTAWLQKLLYRNNM